MRIIKCCFRRAILKKARVIEVDCKRQPSWIRSALKSIMQKTTLTLLSHRHQFTTLSLHGLKILPIISQIKLEVLGKLSKFTKLQAVKLSQSDNQSLSSISRKANEFLSEIKANHIWSSKKLARFKNTKRRQTLWAI